VTRVAAVVWERTAFRVVQVEEGMRGYWRLGALGAFTYEGPAQRVADELNAKNGIPPEVARRIAAAALDGAAPCLDDEWERAHARPRT